MPSSATGGCRSRVKRTKWLYFSSLLEKSLETQKKLAKIYAGKGVKIAFNPSTYLAKQGIAKLRDLSPLWEMFKDGIDLSTIQWAAH